MQQDTRDLFGTAHPASGLVPVAPHSPAPRALALGLQQRHGGRLYLGTSSWYFPGWAGLVWGRELPERTVVQHGLPAYAQHPLLNTVSLDRAFYRPLDAATFAGLAAQVPEAFRFVVKAPALVTDAVLRPAGPGTALRANPGFLDPPLALAHAVWPAVQGLGPKLGTLVFQVSPLPAVWLNDETAWLQRLASLFETVLPALPHPALAALELRDARLLTPALARLLKALGVRCALGLHDRMPTVEDQLPLQRATWPGDLVCRWNLQRGLRYTEARDAWAPFNRLQAPDLPTRQALARVMAGTLKAGHRVFVTVNNKAEGSAPLSVVALAEALWALG